MAEASRFGAAVGAAQGHVRPRPALPAQTPSAAGSASAPLQAGATGGGVRLLLRAEGVALMLLSMAAFARFVDRIPCV